MQIESINLTHSALSKITYVEEIGGVEVGREGKGKARENEMGDGREKNREERERERLRESRGKKQKCVTEEWQACSQVFSVENREQDMEEEERRKRGKESE